MIRRLREGRLKKSGAATQAQLLLAPSPEDPEMLRACAAEDETGAAIVLPAVVERPYTLFLNSQLIVTLMTVGDHLEYLALGYLANQRMLHHEDEITAVEIDPEAEAIVVRTKRATNYEEKLRRRVQTSGCGQGTVFSDFMEELPAIALDPKVRLTAHELQELLLCIHQTPSLYLKAGGIHGCALAQGARPLIYVEDVGRHNAVDKIAGYAFKHGLATADKVFYTSGRLTSEMVIKALILRIPIIVSRSGFTSWAVALAQQVGLTMIARARGRRFLVLSGRERIVRADPQSTEPQSTEPCG